MHLKIQTENDSVYNQYINHSTYHEGDSGLDLFFNEDITLEPKETKIISLGIRCEAFMSKGSDVNLSYYLYPRSSISKTPLRMANSVGIIDAGYRGLICAAVDNTSDEPYTIRGGQRLFQLCSPTLSPITFELCNTLTESSRGEGGFGSTNQ